MGIFTGGAGAGISNTGRIISTGSQEAYGIAVVGDGSSIRNVGLIQAGDEVLGGLASVGVLSHGTANEVYNAGSIRAYGSGATGILSDGDRAVIQNNGSVTADGEASVAVLASGNDVIVRNSGRIDSSGLAATGILTSGDSVTVINTGRIMADLQAFAILMDGSDAVLSLGVGTAIQGNIGFTGPDGLVQIGNGLNTALSFALTPGYVDTNGAPYVINGNALAVVDPTGFSSQDEVLAETTSLIADAIDNRFAAVRSRASGDHAGENSKRVVSSSGPVSGANTEAWATALGGYWNQEREGAGSDFDYGAGGLMVGVDSSASHDTRLGVFAGAISGEMTADTQSQSIANDHYFAGTYVDLSSERYFLDLSVAAGIARFDSKRRIANNLVLEGIEYARADYDGIFLSPSATIGTEISLGGGVLTPSVRARCAALFLDSYKERGSTADLDVDSREVGIFELRGQLAYDFAPVVTTGGRFDWGMRIGANAAAGGGEDADAVLMGQAINISTHDDKSVISGFAGMQALYTDDRSGVQAGVSGEAGTGSGGGFTAKAQAAVSIPF